MIASTVKAFMLLLTCLFCLGSGEVLFQDGFESHPAFGKTALTGWDGPAAPSLMYITNAQASAGSKSLQLDYLPQNIEGSTYAYGWFPREVEDVYVRWYQRWSANYVFGATCNKLLKISQYGTAAAYQGGGEFIPLTAFGSDQLSILGYILKEPDQPKGMWENPYYYQNVGTPVGFERERWYCIEVHIKYNTPGVKDGIIEAWIDGAKKIYYTGREFRGSGPSDCNQYGCNSYLSKFNYIMVTGNRCVASGMTSTQYSWYDDIQVSTARIGYNGTTAEPLAVATTSLPAARQATPYTATLAAVGGKSPYNWTVSAGNFPAGLALNKTTGTISGIPALAGRYDFTVKVLDSSVPVAEATKALTVIVSSNPNPGITGSGSSVGRSQLSVKANTTSVRFVMPQNGSYALKVFDLSGREVWKHSGTGEANWNHGGKLRKGVYLVRAGHDGRTYTANYCNLP